MSSLLRRSLPGHLLLRHLLLRRPLLRPVSIAVLLVIFLAPVSVRIHAQTTDAPAQVAPGEKSTPEAQVPEKKAQEQDENEAYRHSPTVTRLGGMMGMKPEMAATSFTLLNFGILVAGVGYVLLKLLPKTFRKRNMAIQKHLVEARTATEEASARLNSVEDRLSKLDLQIAAMRAQSEADSARDEQRIKANLEAEKAKILAAAEQEIVSATTLARRQIQQYAAELAIEHAARKLIVTAETDRLLVESFAQRLGSGPGSGGGGQN